MSGLQQNRANLGMVGIFQRVFDKMADSARSMRVNGGLLADDPIARNDMAAVRVEIEVLKTVAFNALSEYASGDTTGPDCRHDPRLGWRDAPEGVADLRAARWPARHPCGLARVCPGPPWTGSPAPTHS